MLTHSKSSFWSWLTRSLLLLSLFAFVFAASGCNTWKGAGKDVEKTGEKMQGQ